MRSCLLATLAVVLLAVPCLGAHAAGRVALVIGMSGYRHAPALRNPANDAKAVADALGAAGLSVRVVTDATHDGMIRALREFQVEGIATTIPIHQRIMDTPEFIAGTVDTKFIERAFYPPKSV